MTIQTLKATPFLGNGNKHSIGASDVFLVRIKKVERWFGKDKDNAAVILDNGGHEWLKGAIFGAPAEIAKGEGSWYVIRPTPGELSGVWLEGVEFTNSHTGGTVQRNELKLMATCITPSEPPQQTIPSNPPPTTSQSPNVAPRPSTAVERQVLTDAEYATWVSVAGSTLYDFVLGWVMDATPDGEQVARTPHVAAAAIEAVASLLGGIKNNAAIGSIRLTYGQGGGRQGGLQSSPPPSSQVEGDRGSHPAYPVPGYEDALYDDEIAFGWFVAPLLGSLLWLT